MRDLPTGPALLALARDLLLHDLMPLRLRDHAMCQTTRPVS